MCIPTSGTEMGACGPRATEDLPCMSSACDAFGTCLYGGTCASTGAKQRTCHDYTCRAGTCGDMPYTDFASCTRVTSGMPCDDGNACTTPDTCSADVCMGTPICDAGGIDAGNDAASPDAGSCDDGWSCTMNVWTGFACTYPPNNLACMDGFSCSTDACDPLAAGHDSAGCVHDFSACGDAGPDTGTPRDGGGSTDAHLPDAAGNCTSNPSICNDGNPCTTDACDPSAPLADLNGCTNLAFTCGDAGT
jgi:hypothetical protein